MTSEQKQFVLGMQKAGKLAGETLSYLSKLVKPGISTKDLDDAAFDFIKSHEAIPAPLHYRGYPKSICTSVNDVICHGVPDETKLKEGDIINVDVTVIVNGYHGDTSMTLPVGKITEEAKRLSDVAEQAMFKGIEEVAPGATTGDIGFAINKFTTKNGFYVVQEIGGHGIGTIFHDEPFVPSYGKRGKGDVLQAWKCITVEPMINATSAPIQEFPIEGSSHCYYLTGDKSLSAQFEHTVLITDKGHEILTLRS